MIQFALECENDHRFDGWFRSSEDFDQQRGKELVRCPACGSSKVEKALMAPAISTGKRRDKLALAHDEAQQKALIQLQEITRKIKANAENVGDRFAEEARKIHFGEADARGIYGEATTEQTRDLIDDGVQIIPLPTLPDEQN